MPQDINLSVHQGADGEYTLVAPCPRHDSLSQLCVRPQRDSRRPDFSFLF
jgi:hypothetical protein